MRRRLFAWLALAVALALLGCGASEPGEEQPAGQEEETDQGAAGVAEEEEAPSSEEREDYIKRVEDELKQLDEHIAELKDQARKAGDATRGKIDAGIQELEEKRKVARDKLKRTKAVSEEAWKEIKKGTDAAVVELRKTYEKVQALIVGSD